MDKKWTKPETQIFGNLGGQYPLQAFPKAKTQLLALPKLPDEFKIHSGPIHPDEAGIFSKLTVETDQGNFRVWAGKPGKLDEGPQVSFLFLHGAGHTGLSFSLLAGGLKKQFPVFSLDLRGHGETEVKEEYNMDVDVLVKDIVDVIEGLRKKSWMSPGPLILVGHSLGAALAGHVAHARKKFPVLSDLSGVVQIDVVEGLALQSLRYMESIVKARPKTFTTHNEGTDWALKSQLVCNRVSARLSISSMFRKNESTGLYEWRTDLLKTKPHWKGWFERCSSNFVEAAGVAKLLILADYENLDKILTIGQMQGKYELVIVGHNSGHLIHEDSALFVLQKIANYTKRNKFLELYKLNNRLQKK